MRKIYEDPEFEVIRVQLCDELLGPSTSTFNPEDPLKEDVEEVEP